MKQYYGPEDYEAERKLVGRCELLDNRMSEIDSDCRYYVSDMGRTIIQIYFYQSSSEKGFSEKKVRALMKVLNRHFVITNSTPPKDTESYGERHYRWTRDFREHEGTFHMCRYLNKFFDEPDCDLYLTIENAPLLNCKLIEKERTVRYFEADCSAE